MRERLRGLRWPGESTLYYAACVVLIVVAATLRFYDLPVASLWHDEAVAANNATGTISDVVENTRNENTSPILWPLGLWVIQKIERSSLSVRVVPATASVLTVAAILFLLPRAGIRRSSALLAGAIMAVSTGAINEAQEVREYSIDTLLAVVMLAGAMLWMRGEKWMLLVSLFLAPFLQYGLVLLGVAIVAAVTVKQGSGIRWSEWRKSARRFLLPMAWPVLSLCAGSVMTWFITLRYQFEETGHGIDNYLATSYYQGDFSDIFAIFQFVYYRNINLVGYHIEHIPVILTAILIIAALIVSREYRNSILTLILAGSVMVTSFVAVIDWYPLGGIRQLLFLGPIIVVSFACTIPAIIDQIRAGDYLPYISLPVKKFTKGCYSALAAIGFSISITAVGISSIITSDGFYNDAIKIDPVLAALDQSKGDDDLVLGPVYLRATVSWHRGDPSPSYLWCWPGECVENLQNILDEFTGKLWLITNNADLYSEIWEFQEAIHVLEPLKIETIIASDTSLFLLHDARNLAAKFKNIGESFAERLQDFGNPVARRGNYSVYLDTEMILYVSDNCEDDRRFFIHFYPQNIDSLPAQFSHLGFESVSFLFHDAISAGDQCFKSQELPPYPVKDFVTGQLDNHGGDVWRSRIDPRSLHHLKEIDSTFLDNLPDAVLDNPPFLIHISARTMVYITAHCDFPEGFTPLYLHVYPVNVEDLPAGSREHGFENLDFVFSELGNDVEGDCVVVRALPTYPVSRIETGQYVSETGEKIWRGVIEGELVE